MATRVPAVSSSTEKTVRHTADFHPSLWGNHFQTRASDLKTIDAANQEHYEALKEEARRMITATANTPAQKLQLIDTVQRLGVAYHYAVEIENELEKIHHELDNNDHDLYTVSLRFRLLRQQGIKISCDVFEKFKNDEGKFKASLINNVQGMLSLHEAAYLAIRGEDILDEAIAFTTTHLKSMISFVNPNLAEQINHAIYRPLRKTIVRLEARYFLDIYPRDDSHDKTLLKFAKLDFNMVQGIHQKELSYLTQWWRDLDFATKLHYARDRLVESYFWTMAVYFEPKYALVRRIMAKIIVIASVLDDTFDAYATFKELKLFTEVSKRWDIGAIDRLPEYMKIIYKTLFDFFNENEEELAKDGKSYCIHYAKEKVRNSSCHDKEYGFTYEIIIFMDFSFSFTCPVHIFIFELGYVLKVQELILNYFVEANWFNEGYVPTVEEYNQVGLVTSVTPGLIINSFLGMGDLATKEVFEWLFTNPRILTASSLVARLLNDTESHKFEQERGHIASAVECYMKQHGVSEEDAVKVLGQEIANAWKDMNEELLKPTPIPLPMLERILNLACICDVMYKDGDRYTNSYLVEEQVASVLRDPIML